MVEGKEQVKKKLWKVLESIIDHGQGQVSINVGAYGKDKTTVFINAGKSYRFYLERFIED